MFGHRRRMDENHWRGWRRQLQRWQHHWRNGPPDTTPLHHLSRSSIADSVCPSGEITEFGVASLSGPNAVLLPAPYNAIRQLGLGGEGGAWLAQDTWLARYVVCKRLSGISAQQPDAALHTLQTLVGRSPQAMPDIYSVAVNGDAIWLVTEYVPGQTLAALDAQCNGRPLPLPYVLLIMIDLVAALSQLASVGLVHGDLSPANIIIDDHGHARLIDFGQATRINDPVSGRGVHGFAPRRSGHAYSAVTDDSYALGAILFWLLSAQVPTQLLDAAGQAVYLAPTCSNAPGPLGDMLWTVARTLIEPDPLRQPSLSTLLTSLRRDLSDLPLGTRDNLARSVIIPSTPDPAEAVAADRPNKASSAAGHRRSPLAWIVALLMISAIGCCGLWLSTMITRPSLRVAIDALTLTAQTQLDSTFTDQWVASTVQSALGDDWRVGDDGKHVLTAGVDCDDRLCQLLMTHSSARGDHVHQDLILADASTVIWQGALESLTRDVAHCLANDAR